MKYRCISADYHMDLCWLPHDLFVANASNAMKERIPRVEQGPDGPTWITPSGLNLGFANGINSTATRNDGPRKYVTAGGGRLYEPGKEHRIDRMASTGLFADGAQGIFRPSTPELRLKEQE